MLATFSLLSLATSAIAKRSLRQSGCNLSQQEDNCCANSNSCHSTKQCNRHVAIEPQVKTLGEAQRTQLKQSRASKSPTQTREHPTATKLFWMGQGKLGRGAGQQHKKATPHSASYQNEQQTTGGMEFLHIYDTWYEYVRRTSRQDRRSTHMNDASFPRCRGLLPAAPPPVCSWLSKASLNVIRIPGTTVRRSSFSSFAPRFLDFVFLSAGSLKKKYRVPEEIILFAAACCIVPT